MLKHENKSVTFLNRSNMNLFSHRPALQTKPVRKSRLRYIYFPYFNTKLFPTSTLFNTCGYLVF